MLVRSSAILMALAIALVASDARAGTLTSATWATQLPGLAPNAAIGVPVIASGTSTSTSVAVSLVLPPFQGGVFGTTGPINTYRGLTIAGSALLTATPSMAAATKAVEGEVVLKVAHHAAKGANASMLTAGPTTLFKMPISAGGAGSTTDLFYVSGITHYVTVDFYGWSVGMQTFTGLTSQGAPLPSVMATGAFALTPMGGGNVLLVSPTRISIDGALSQRRGVFLSTLQLSFAPEPTVLLLGAVGAAVALLASRRRS